MMRPSIKRINRQSYLPIVHPPSPSILPAGSTPRITVISLLVWDSIRYLDNLLRNLEAWPPGGNFHLRILDQGSCVQTRNLLQDFAGRHPHTSVDLLDSNIGYSAGHNRNFESVRRRGHFDYFVTINDDLVFGAAGWLDTMVRTMEAMPDAAVGGPICYADDPDIYRPATLEEKLAGRFMFVTGAVAIIRSSAVHRFGLLDEIYTPAYWEDADLCMRFQHFGQRQIFIDIPVFHAYLGDMERVNQAKSAELSTRHGDFRRRNLQIFHDRWRAAEVYRKFPDVAGLRATCPRLYIPPGYAHN